MNESKAIGYIRVSTRDQAENGVSLEAQRAKIEAHADQKGLELAEVIVDGGHSAKSMTRPGMEKLLRLIRGRKIGAVIVAKKDRITRRVRDLDELVELFQRTGVRFLSATEDIDTKTAAGRMILNVMGSVAQWEREVIGERTAEALATMRANGRRISRHPPYGYRFNGQGWIEDQDEQQAVAIMRRLRADGWSLRKIAAELERLGHHSRVGGRLSAKTIANALSRT